MKPIPGSNNPRPEIDISTLSESETEAIFDHIPNDNPINELFSQSVNSNRTKPISTLASIKALLRQAIDAIHNALFGQDTKKTLLANIRDSNIKNVDSREDKIKYESIATQEKINFTDQNNQKRNSEDISIDDFEIIEPLDDFNMGDGIKIEDESKNIEDNIFPETTSLIDRKNTEVNSENYLAFTNWYKSGADLNAIPDEAIPYARFLIGEHTGQKKIDDNPKLKEILGGANSLINQFNLNNKNKLENISLEISDLSNSMLNDLKIEMSEKNKFTNDWSDYVIQALYPENYSDEDNSEVLQTKNDAKIFLDWKAKWSNIKVEGDRAQESGGLEGTKRVKNYYKELFNKKYQASIEELEACNRFIIKYESIVKNSSLEKKQEIEDLLSMQYIKDFLEFYNSVQIKNQAIKIKKDAEVKEVNLEASVGLLDVNEIPAPKTIKDISTILPGIIAFQSMQLEDIESMHRILAPALPSQNFQKMMGDAKSYFLNLINNELKITDDQRIAAMGIATLWAKLAVNAQSITNKPETSNFFGPIGSFFTRDLLAELQAFPNFEKLNALFDLEKISNDFK